MPPKSLSPLFLGLELATDQLRASIVDDNLELVGVEAVDFDSELPEYHVPKSEPHRVYESLTATVSGPDVYFGVFLVVLYVVIAMGGIFTTPGDAYTTPVEMWLKAFDILLEKLSRNYELPRVKAIGGAAQQALVWWKAPVPPLAALDPRLPIHAQLAGPAFSLENTAISQDTSAHTHALALEAALGSPDVMAARVGTCAHPSLVAAQLLRVREAWPEVWARTGRVQVASSFLASLVCGALVGMGESEASATGLWVHSGGAQGGRGEADLGWLGDVDVSGGRRRIGNVSRYLVDRYGFDPEAIVTPFTSDILSTYLSLCPSPSDAVMSFGPMDVMLAPAPHFLPTRLYSLFPHPAQDANEKRRYVAMLTSRNADVPRALVRDMYTKSWSAFDRLVAIVPPGGSIGLDDKLFSFWLLQGDSYPFSHVKGIFRFETGVKVNEFRDLRANPRCLLESQILSFRVRWSRVIATGVLGASAGRARTATPVSGGQQKRSTNNSNNMGLPFDPYDYAPLPSRILATGAAANFPSIANLAGDVFNAPVLVPTTQIDAAQIVPHRNAPATGFPARAALGGAYVARWVWGKEKGTPAGTGRGGFEEEVRRLLGKRWAATGGAPLRTNVNGPGSTSKAGSTAGSGASTPYGHGPRSALGSTVLVEEEEDEMEEMERMSGGVRTVTSSTAGTTMTVSTLGEPPSTAFTTPDLGGLTSPNVGTPTADPAATSTPTALTPVTAMPTSEAETQMGLAKVAEPDVDAFMSYAAIVPEYCRLEGLLIKAIV
ncbi:putative D-xylulose kinase A [Grifola frondosa]|uniref:Putative D-xylulose kinase A n=1 Tax=Grifola frondosa TaxID=5627 RepID=A0A1C7M8F2_GRIFR|nr:putative D-xylulose kinase A [Grifola frondosa]